MSSRLPLLIFVILTVSTHASFFNGGCGCQPPPLCLPPPPPMCFTEIQLPPIRVPIIPLPRIELPQPCCPTCACGRKKREVDHGVGEESAPEETVSTKDVSCNDDTLLEIMKKEMSTGESSAVKIALVEAAEQQLGGRYTVVCSQGAFSFVTSTTNYCLHSQAGLNCYLFKTQ
uniref:Ground-like domain-containing protein n=1 Tax=Caenorhabditis japonica TaxID=281687 RepID=A0A8R1DNB0_CAEJA